VAEYESLHFQFWLAQLESRLTGCITDAVSSGNFKDDEAEQVKDLKDIAGGRLHALKNQAGVASRNAFSVSAHNMFSLPQ